MSNEKKFSVSIEDNKAIIVDYNGYNAEIMSKKFKRSSSVFAFMHYASLFSMASYFLYGVISWMYGSEISTLKLAGFAVLFIFMMVFLIFSDEHRVSYSKYIAAYSEAKIKLQNEMMESEKKLLKHRLDMEQIEKNHSFQFVGKEREINA